MTSAQFRRLALAFEGAEERAHMGHPDFRVRGRIFATLHGDRKFAMVKLPPDQQQAFAEAYPAVFTPEAGAWGRQGCTRVTLAAASEESVGEALTLAWGKAGQAGRAGRAGQAGQAPSYVALLRAVNVGGARAVSMPVLCDLFAAAGYAGVRSLLQSGNVVFTGRGEPRRMERVIEKIIEARLKLQTDVLVRSAGEWAALVAANPFRDEAERDPGHLLALVAKTSVAEAAVRALQERITGRERIACGDRVVYAVYPDGVGRSRLTTAAIERALNTRVTGRNWNTVTKIARLLAP